MTTIRLLHVSDTHLREVPDPQAEVDPEQALRRALSPFTRLRNGGRDVDVIVHTGDIADDASLTATRRVADLLGEVCPTVLGVPGNHDDQAVVAAVFDTTLEIAGWRLLGLDTVIAGETHGRIDADTVAARLDGLDERPTVLFMHHPIRSASTHPWFTVQGAAELTRVLVDRPQVRAVLSGHTHEWLDDHLGADTSSGDSAAGCRLRGGRSTWYSLRHDGDRWEKSGEPTGADLLLLTPAGRVDG